MQNTQHAKAAVIVAHPDDETIWTGGTILMHPDWHWTIVSLCRGNDLDRAPKFQKAVQKLSSTGIIGNLNDEPEQLPIDETEVQQTLLSLLPRQYYDLILTHSPYGEYTRHRRHEETSKAVISLWGKGIITVGEVWMFAYEDSGKGGVEDLPHTIKTSHLEVRLSDEIWLNKYSIITKIYGFSSESYESLITLREEAFWCFHSPLELQNWLKTERRK